MTRKFLSGGISTLITGALMFVSYRLYLRYLGYERYGLWLLLSTILNVVQLGSVGLGPALTKLISQTEMPEQDSVVQRYLLTSVSLVLGAGLTLGLLVVGRSAALVALLHLTRESAASFQLLLPYFTVLSVYAVVVDLFLAALSGLGRIDLGNYAQLLSQVTGTVASVLLLRAGWGLPALLCGMVIYLVFLHVQLFIHIAGIVTVRFPRRSDWHPREVRLLLRFGGWAAGSTIVNASIGPVTRVLLARFSGLASVPAFDLALSASYKLRGVWESAMRPLLPEVSRLTATGHQVNELYRKASRVLLAGSAPLYALVFVFAFPILQLWLGAKGGTTVGTLRILLAATFINLLAVPPYYVLMGIGRVRDCFVASALMAAVSLSCAGLAIHRLATLPVEIASASFLLGTSFLTVYLTWQANEQLNPSPRSREIVRPGTEAIYEELLSR